MEIDHKETTRVITADMTPQEAAEAFLATIRGAVVVDGYQRLSGEERGTEALLGLLLVSSDRHHRHDVADGDGSASSRSGTRMR